MTSALHAEPWLVVHDLQGKFPELTRHEYDSRNEPLCAGDGRGADNPLEKRLAYSGWILWLEADRQGELELIRIVAALDGQCRPNGTGAVLLRQGVPAMAWFPTSDFENLEFSLSNGELMISQRFVKPGEANCCGTGSRELVVVLDRQ